MHSRILTFFLFLEQKQKFHKTLLILTNLLCYTILFYCIKKKNPELDALNGFDSLDSGSLLREFSSKKLPLLLCSNVICAEICWEEYKFEFPCTCYLDSLSLSILVYILLTILSRYRYDIYKYICMIMQF
jgi:hypothetical protein